MATTAGLMYPKPEPNVLRKAAIKAEEEKAWTACKRRVRKRDGGRCRLCGRAGVTPDPHHILARSLGGRDIDSNVISLCRQHHDWCKPGLLQIEGNPEQRVKMTIDPRVSKSGREEVVYR